MEGMRILGIDPGLGIVGFGFLETLSSGGTLATGFQSVEWGVVTTSKDRSESQRLQEIYHDFTAVLQRFQPDHVSIERIFFFKNAKTLIPVSQARGVLLLAVEAYGASYSEYTPMQVKQAMTGSGKATKQEVQQMVAQVLQLDKLPRPDDAADALGLAVCHAHHAR